MAEWGEHSPLAAECPWFETACAQDFLNPPPPPHSPSRECVPSSAAGEGEGGGEEEWRSISIILLPVQVGILTFTLTHGHQKLCTFFMPFLSFNTTHGLPQLKFTYHTHRVMCFGWTGLYCYWPSRYRLLHLVL